MEEGRVPGKATIDESQTRVNKFLEVLERNYGEGFFSLSESEIICELARVPGPWENVHYNGRQAACLTCLIIMATSVLNAFHYNVLYKHGCTPALPILSPSRPATRTVSSLALPINQSLSGIL